MSERIHEVREVNLYDFDKTIYDGDSTIDFYVFSVRKNPILLAYLPLQFVHCILFLLKFEDKTKFKSNFFIFLRGIDDIPNYVDQFWQSHFGNIKKWYLDKDHTSDVLISASPSFLLQPIVNRLNVHTLLATEVDVKTGAINGLNCYGEEKVARFRDVFPDLAVTEAYSDHLSDMPILKLAKQAYIVIGDKIISFRDYSNMSKLQILMMRMR